MMHDVLVVTVSDRASRGERPDLGGPAVAEVLRRHGFNLLRIELVSDMRDDISEAIGRGVKEGAALIVTTGGTGFSQRDVTPEATIDVIERRADGIAEEMRRRSLESTRHALLSRAVCGIAGSTLIMNLPGSPAGACECLEAVIDVLPHALRVLRDADIPDGEHRHRDQSR